MNVRTHVSGVNKRSQIGFRSIKAINTATTKSSTTILSTTQETFPNTSSESSRSRTFSGLASGNYLANPVHNP